MKTTMKQSLNLKTPSQQQGATLIVALVLLAIVTILGVAGMRGTTLEMKMIASARDRAVAFEAAEAALKVVENDLMDFANAYPNAVVGSTVPDLPRVSDVFGKDCKAPNAGYCFSGILNPADPYGSCSNYDPDDPQLTPLWEDSALWKNNSGAHLTVNVPVTLPDGTAQNITARYIVEFMCFSLKDKEFLAIEDDKNNSTAAPATHMPMYRITALAEGLGRRSRVMAQSVVKLDLDEGF